MGFAFYIIVNQSLIRHIVHISQSRKLSSLKNNSHYVPLKLSRATVDDELSDLVDVLNEGKKIAVELLEAKKDQQTQLEYQASFDLLTGLPNRNYLYRFLQECIDNYHPDFNTLAIMFIDLDGFKQVNDSMGHSIGDKVLKSCANRLKNITDGIGGFISRLGGDEFIVCFYEDCIDKKSFAEKIIQSFEEKVNIQGVQVKLGCSIGITTYPDKDFNDPKQLIRNADSALYKAKALGRNTFFFFNNDIREEIILENKVKEKIHEAIELKKFMIYYQPLIDIKNNKIYGFEALLRWCDEDLGWVSPDLFVSVAERAGIIFDIDTWVFDNAIKQVSEWREKYQESFYLSVNFSPNNFYHSKFIEWINSNVYLQNKELNWLELEITERIILNNDTIVIDGINLLRNKGVSFSIDDFGVGYSSLGYIKTFNSMLSKIKIDRIFIDEILKADFNIAFVKSIMMLSNSLGLSVLAEGVEERGQVDTLKELGCCYAQGYYFSRPIPESDIIEFIETWNACHFETIHSYSQGLDQHVSH